MVDSNPISKLGRTPGFHGSIKESVLFNWLGQSLKQYRGLHPDVHPQSIIFSMLGFTRSLAKLIGISDEELQGMMREVSASFQEVERRRGQSAVFIPPRL